MDVRWLKTASYYKTNARLKKINEFSKIMSAIFFKKGLKSFITQYQLLPTLGEKPFENVWKKEKMLITSVSLFPKIFSTILKKIAPFEQH